MMKSLKVQKFKSLSLAALLIASATFAACSSSDDSIIEEQPVENPTATKTYTMTIQATKGGDAATTRGLSLDDKTLNVTWNENEEVEVFQKTQVTPEKWTPLGKLKAKASSDGTTTLTGELTGLKDDNASTYPLRFFLHSGDVDYKNQNGVLDRDDNATKSIEDNYDYASSTAVDNYTVDGNKVVVSGGITLTSLQAIVKFTLVDAIKGNPVNATSLKIKGSQNMIESMSPTAGTKLTKELTITPPSATNVIYAAISSVGNSNFTLTATVGDDTYTYTKSGVTFTVGKYYEVKVKMLKYYEAVDLGLPSGTKWATMNVGATSVTDRGLYFAWGETTGHAFGSGYDFSLDKYAWYNSTDKYTKYKHDGSSWDYEELESDDDAATRNWGGVWRMPTKAEWEELLNENNCTWTWTTDYKGDNSNVAGVIVTSKKAGYTDKSIFLPATGQYNGDNNTLSETYATYWSKSLDTDNRLTDYEPLYYNDFAWKLEILYNAGSFYYRRVQNEYRYYGIGVRAVRK